MYKMKRTYYEDERDGLIRDNSPTKSPKKHIKTQRL